MRHAVLAAARRAHRYVDARLGQWMSPQRAAVARVALAWLRHLLFPRWVGEPDPRLLAEVHRLGRESRPLPGWAVDEMRVQAEFEPQVFPSRARIAKYHFFRIPHEFEAPGRAFARLYAAAGEMPVDHVILVPWLKVGGADRAALLHAEAMSEAFGKRVLVMATEAADSPWAGRLPAGVRFLPAGSELAALDHVSRCHVLARLVLQWKPESVHIINSIAAWETVSAYGRALASETRILASAFCDDITDEGERISAARLHARDCAPFLSGLLTDCRYYADVLVRDTGISADRVHVVYLPVDPPAAGLWTPPSGPPTVLWAGRLDRQKRPDVLALIAERRPDVGFEVFGTQATGPGSDTLMRLAALPNVRLRGPYDAFDSLPWQESAAFLYTAQWDGLPNVLLEAAVRGMPLIAPNVGGIAELLGSHVAMIERCDDVDAYVAAVASAVGASPAKRPGTALVEMILTRHSREGFLHALRACMIDGLDSDRPPAHCAAPAGARHRQTANERDA
jgi:glycosyltransferase involved in cell wall biosynthesis